MEVPCHHPECWQPFIGCLLPLSPLKLSYWWKRCFPLLICCLSLCELPPWPCLASLQQTLTVKSRAFATQLLAAIHFQARMKPASTMKVCTFHLQGRCKFGMRGQKEEDGKLKMCPFFHPKVCEKYLAHGKRGCNTGCKRLHPKMCQNVKKCYYSYGNYHMNDTKIQHQPVTKSDTASPRRITQDHCVKISSYINRVSNDCS